ncbi:selenocysteine-specific translation elongation factor [Tundrisphaera lichenicola]|uniref:selenocysteine-specific translation elongation factor n=1 Tax=Tundrisphaera lichenicola TaxID=2029860 RepID=UPI003EC0F5E8
MPGKVDLVLGTAGHIDHGKTALVRALTGVDTDRLPAEKQRGITIDLGFASLDLPGHRVALVDVPGHERFIRNMLAGASGLDLAMLIVAADDSVMPQTREHLEILQLLGLSGGLIVLTKCDLADESWLDLVEEDLRTLVNGTFLESAEIVRTSATSGRGIEELKASLTRVCDQAPPRDDPGLFRMAIDRSFTLAGHGTVVTGAVASGELVVGSDLEWFPEGRPVRVRGIHRHDQSVERVGRGARAAINLGGVHHREVQRGDELAEPGYLRASRVLSVEVRESIEAVGRLRHRARYRVHVGTAEVAASLSLLDREAVESSTGLRLAQLFLAEPIATVHGQPFVIREESPPATVGGGRVLQPVARRIRRRDLLAKERLRRLGSVEGSTRIASALAFQGLSPWTDRTLCRDSGVPISEVRPTVEKMVSSGELITLPVGPRRTVQILAEFVVEIEDRVLRAIARLHQASPRMSTIARARVASALADLENDALVAGIIDRLKSAGRVVGDARTIALSGHEPRLSQGERKLKKEIAEAYRSGGFTPPDSTDWTLKGGPRASTVPDLLALLRDEEQLVEISPGLYLDHDIEVEMRSKVISYFRASPGMTVADLRDLLGTSRKFAVPLAEYLDRIGLTHREGDIRTLARKITSTLDPGEEL